MGNSVLHRPTEPPVMRETSYSCAVNVAPLAVGDLRTHRGEMNFLIVFNFSSLKCEQPHVARGYPTGQHRSRFWLTHLSPLQGRPRHLIGPQGWQVLLQNVIMSMSK